ncbi:hypothetical protein D5H75_37945 [Bailinhaonella thermotolerans]|uniref:Uncharacterized protein n=1 Tax=Bailinhaonella thermotolerans TaxID=1070861 RepID=A0A3A3ZZM4_9ACTN|nr:hypothetical protein D5H75_37945 [Bailinhaonella thermotolerans]
MMPQPDALRHHTSPGRGSARAWSRVCAPGRGRRCGGLGGRWVNAWPHRPTPAHALMGGASGRLGQARERGRGPGEDRRVLLKRRPEERCGEAAWVFHASAERDPARPGSNGASDTV